MTKAISAVIATIMLLMISIALISVFYVFSSDLVGTTTSAGSQQASQLTGQLSSCMQIQNIVGNQVTLRNCGKGVIENKSLIVTMDDVKLGTSTNTIMEGNSSIVNISGLWRVPFGKHNLKISNGAAFAQALVEVQPNKGGLVGSWNFDAGTGSKAYDDSGNNNIGTLGDGTCQPGSGSCPSWVDGKFGKGLQFDGVNDYVDAGNASNLLPTDAITVEAWIYPISLGAGTYGRIVAKNDFDYALLIQGDTIITFNIGGTAYGTTPIGSVPLNMWSHVVATFDKNLGSEQVKTYVNGVYLANGTKTTSISYTINNVHIGNNAFLNRGFNGTIDEVRIWNRALAPDETVVMKQVI